MAGRFQRAIAMAATAALAVSIGGCSQGRDPTITRGWVRLAVNPGAPAAAYFTLEGGRAPDTLTAISAAWATKAEMHETMTHGTMSEMTPLRHVPVPAGTAVAFRPGGRHVMMFGVKPGVKPHTVLSLRFTFASGRMIEGPLSVIGPGEPAPY